MSGKFTNNLQAAILYEGGGEIHPSIHLNPFRMAMLAKEIPFKIVQENRNFAFMMGPGELQIMVTYYDHPANPAAFEGTLGSAITGILMSDARERVRRHTAHVLVEIHHGVLGGAVDNAQMAGFFDQIGMKRPGASLREFNMRVEILGEVCRHLLKVQPASAIHWTQSNMLIAGEKFLPFLDQAHPSMLTVHPKLFGAEPMPGFKELPAGLLTLGAADYLGREIYVAPAPIPWFELYEISLVFMRMALMPNGYVVPDGDTLGPESNEFSYLVRHLNADEHPLGMREPVYALTAKYAEKHGFTTMEHETRTPVRGGMREVAHEIEPDRTARQDLISDWEKRERAANAIGGGLKLFRKGDDGSDELATVRSDPAFRRFVWQACRLRPQTLSYWNAVSEKLRNLRECSRSIGISASFSIARMPILRCCATWRL